MIKTKPSIRFAGFTDDWEERKLGELGHTFTGLSGKTKDDFGHGDAKFVTYMNVFLNPISSLTEIDAVESDDKQHQVQKGDVFFTTSSETPEEVGMSSVWLFDIPNVYLNSFSFGYRPITQFDLNYLAFMLRSPQVRKAIMLLAQGISRYNISKTKMMEIEVPVPSMEEQKAVGRFFSNLDNTIVLHQRQLDLLKEQKKGFLQKMFPKNGAKVPELRFAGFTDDWEERKFGELLKEFSIKSKIEDEYNVLSSTNSGMEFREGRVSGSSNLGYKIIKNGDLVLSPQNLWLGNININNIGKGLVSPSYKTFEFRNIDSSFINPQLRTQKMLEEYKNSSTQGASVVRRNLEIDSFYQIKIFVPTITEQEKIGSFFKQLDDTIALHQRQLVLLKEQKKGLLQQMFPKQGAKALFGGVMDEKH